MNLVIYKENQGMHHFITFHQIRQTHDFLRNPQGGLEVICGRGGVATSQCPQEFLKYLPLLYRNNLQHQHKKPQVETLLESRGVRVLHRRQVNFPELHLQQIFLDCWYGLRMQLIANLQFPRRRLKVDVDLCDKC